MKIVKGSEVFRLVDTYGIPLDIVVLEFRQKGLGFNIKTFIDSALKAGWKKKRIFWVLKSAQTTEPEAIKIIEKYLETLG